MRNRALLSVYHYGRRGRGPLSGRPVPLAVLPLHRAVTILIEEPKDRPKREALHAIRLALADLCRTRAVTPDSRIDREIERLSIALSKLTDDSRQEHEHAEFAQSFAQSSYSERKRPPGRERDWDRADREKDAKEQMDLGAEAYHRALEQMVKLSQTRSLHAVPGELWTIRYKEVASK
jgi:hypothetical protein